MTYACQGFSLFSWHAERPLGTKYFIFWDFRLHITPVSQKESEIKTAQSKNVGSDEGMVPHTNTAYCLSFQKPRLFLHTFFLQTIWNILYFTLQEFFNDNKAFCFSCFVFSWWIRFCIMNAVHDTVTFSGVCPKFSFSLWWMAPDGYVLIVLLPAFSILFHFYWCFIYCLSQKKYDLMQYLFLKKVLALFFLPFSFVFSLTSVCFWRSWLSYFMHSCLRESPSMTQPTPKVLCITLWHHQESFVAEANICHSRLFSIYLCFFS